MLPGIGVFGTGPVVKVLVPILRENGFKIEAIWSQTIQDAEEAAEYVDNFDAFQNAMPSSDINYICRCIICKLFIY